jgi:hypothetical protein
MSARSLTPKELAEAQKIFGDGLDYNRVRVNEGGEFPNFVGRVGAFFRGGKPPEANAITVGDCSYFPRLLKTEDQSDRQQWLTDMGWLMHELTHQWQFQHDGPRYLIEAIFAPTYVYTPPNESHNGALKGFSKAGKKFRGFNREQQGDIVRDYFWSTQLDGDQADRSGWDTYLTEVRTPVVKERPRG